MLESARDADLRVRMPRLPPASEPARAPAVGGAPADVPALWWLRALAPDVPLRHREIGGGPARFAGRLVELRRPRRGQPGERGQVHEEDGAGVRGRSRRRFRVRHGRGDGRGRGRRGARRRIHGRLGSVRSIVKVQAHDSFDAVGASASATGAALRRLAEASGLAVSATVEERCPVLALPRSWETYLASLSGKHRHELQRKMRRLEREAPEARVSSAGDPAEVGARLSQFLVLHRRSRVGKARFMDERMEGFFRRVLAALAARDGARVWLLETAAGPIASFITLEWDGTVGLYNSGFDPQRAALSLGVVLLTHLVRDAIERSKRTFA